MNIAMIAAMAKNRVIGAENDMPWHLPADLKHFKKVTMGKPVIMGRKTYESIGKALPGRENIVITTNTSYTLSDAHTVTSPEAALELASSLSESNSELMIIGGGAIYSLFLPLANRLYLTYIDLEVTGDTQFPDFNSEECWVEVAKEAHVANEKDRYDHTFVTLERK